MKTAGTASPSLKDAFASQLESAVELLPGLISALLILLVGWAVARVARSGVQRLAVASNQLLSRAFPRVFGRASVSTSMATLVGEAAFWIVALFALAIAARVAGLTSITDWLGRVAAHLPNLLAGGVIFAGGYFISVYVREQISPRSAAKQSATRTLLGRLAQSGMVIVSLIVALDQVGIDVALIIGLVVTAVALTGLAFGLAFGIGAREHVANLIGARSAGQQLSEGVQVRIGELEGTVLEISTTQIVLDTQAGRVLVPAGRIDTEGVTILTDDSRGEVPHR